MLELLGALVALGVVLVIVVGLSIQVTRRMAKQRQLAIAEQRTRTLQTVERELEELEALKSNRTPADDELYARLIRRRNVLVAA